MRKIVYSIACILTLSACTKEIELDLKDADPRLVVESLVTDDVEPFTVKLTLLTPYFDNTGERYVNNAQVYISDDLGTVDTLWYTSNGIYATNGTRQGVPGRTYSLRVIYDGVEYNASETMQTKSYIDSVSYIYNEGSAFIDPGYNVILNTQDDPNEANYYRFSFFKNDTIQDDPFKYFVTDDLFVEGNYIIAQVPFNYQSGDTARVELLNITKPYYLYLVSISNQVQATGGPFDPIPANPPTNLNKGALGYFAVVARDDMSIVLP